MAKGSGKGEGSPVLSIVGVLCSLGEFGFSVGITILLWQDLATNSLCLLEGYNIRNMSICNYAYALAAWSILVSFCVGLLMLFTSCCGKVSHIIGIIFGVGMICWWLAGAIILTYYGVEANSQNFPQQQARNMVIGFSWAVFALFCIGTGVECKSAAD
mmetsp:Transcript_13328/g.33795  ORF Transcript_13328/g.33795 Transcript_13328/m.33795 type:complete len:158 (+) Transcript_13328:208-681(+)